MNKLKMYKFIEKNNNNMTPSLDIGCRVGGCHRLVGIRASRIRFAPANRVGLEKGRVTSRSRDRCTVHLIVGAYPSTRCHTVVFWRGIMKS